MKHNVMDYSLLIVLEKSELNPLLNASLVKTEDTRNKYGDQHLGIIDYLIPYGSSKKMETWYKTTVMH